MAKFLHIGFNFDKSEPDHRHGKLVPVFDTATDWLRYAPNCWIVYTTRTPAEWYELLKPHLEPEKDSVFICELDVNNRYGALTEASWDWLQKKR